MAGFENREGFGALFEEHNKRSENGPDWRGSFRLNGVEYEIAGWAKSGARGTFLSLKVQPQRQKTEASKQTVAEINERVQQRLSSADMDDEIPF
jgi:hypothetical protein